MFENNGHIHVYSPGAGITTPPPPGQFLFSKNEEDPIKNEGARVATTFCPIISQGEPSVTMVTTVFIQSV